MCIYLILTPSFSSENLQRCIEEVAKCFDKGKWFDMGFIAMALYYNCAFMILGNYIGAKEGLAKMKYLVNIEEELHSMLDVN